MGACGRLQGLDLPTLASPIFAPHIHPRRCTMIKFTLPDMSCGHCVATVTQAIKTLDSKAVVKADLSARTVSVDTSVPAGAVSKAMEEAGYPNRPA
jgi:copper chaperone